MKTPQRPFQKLALLFALPIAAISLGCGDVEHDRIQDADDSIIRGTTDLDHPVANAVVQIRTSTGFCSGTLITSTLVLTAAHCTATEGSTVYIGLDNRHSDAPPSTVPNADRGQRTVTAVTRLAALDEPLGDHLWARDVAVLRIWPPIVSEASPQKPTLAPLPWNGNNATLPMGMAGYGRIDFDQTIRPAERQVLEGSLTIKRTLLSSGFGYITYESVSSSKSNVSGTGHGDSGGPFYRGGGHGRDPFAVISSGNCDPVPSLFCSLFGICNYKCVTYAADLTAPATVEWLTSLADPNGDGRWEGEVDYPRASYTKPPTPCTNGRDLDCDGVLDHHDNCRYDWNPDQYNSDEPQTFAATDFVAPRFDPKYKADPGDACDSCFDVRDYGANCNAEAEIAHFGPRPYITESDIVNNAYPPDKLVRNRERYRGDACDPSPCVTVGYAEIPLDPSLAPVPNPLPPECLAGPFYGASGCAYLAPAKIERKAIGGVGWSSPEGETGYALCNCEGPFKTPQDRWIHCFANNTCPIREVEFRTSPKLHALTSAQFQPIVGGTETGTTDVFSPIPAGKSSFIWDFIADYESITNTVLPNPLTPSAIESIQLKGLIQSNVRSFPGRYALVGSGSAGPVWRADLASYWEPVELDVGLGFTSYSRPPTFRPMPAAFCRPICPVGVLEPWIWVINPPNAQPSRVIAATSEHSVDITSRFDANTLALFSDSSNQWIHATEPAAVLQQLSETNARSVVLEPNGWTLTHILRQNEDGSFDVEELPPSFRPYVGSPGVHAFSGVTGELYTLLTSDNFNGVSFSILNTRGPFQIQVGVLSAISNPLAMVYNWYDKALYVVDSPTGFTTAVLRLLRLTMHGDVTVLATLPRPTGGDAYLNVGIDGSVIFGTSRPQFNNFRVMAVSVTGDTPVARKLAQGTGALATAPFTDGTILYVAHESQGSIEFTEFSWSSDDVEALSWLVVQ